NKQRYLGARASGDAYRQLDLVLPCEHDCAAVLCGISNDSHDYCADKELAKPELLAGSFYRANQYLAYHYYADHAGCKQDKRLFLAPLRMVFFNFLLAAFLGRRNKEVL